MNKSLIVLFLIAISCEGVNNTVKNEVPSEQKNEIVNSAFQDILDSVGVDGSILILCDNVYYSNDFEWAKKGQLPASTFKIPNSIIALELGVIHNDSTRIEWDGKPRYQKRWEQDLYFRDAFHYSCVPCYQEIARIIGTKQMTHYMNDFNYGSMKFDSTNLDMFWLQGNSQINLYQQISFLKTFNEQRLPISIRTYNIMQRMMIIEDNKDYIIRGKTGWSVQDGKNNCWFVGYIKAKNKFCYFATNIEPGNETNIDSIPSIRKAITYEALESLGIFSDN